MALPILDNTALLAPKYPIQLTQLRFGSLKHA
jgi:hypothetical protein